MTRQLSIIIPMLNEAFNIRKLLSYLLKNSSIENIAEIIVVDGGSTDNSENIVKKIIDTKSVIKLLRSDQGRAKQMNLGAKHATGSILYFLHADSLPPKNFDQQIINEIINGNNAGCFKMKFDDGHWWLSLVSWFTKFNYRACRGGDQSQFVTKSLFYELGKFDENYIIYEDYEFINKLYAKSEFVVIQQTLISSVRRYNNNGIWKLQYHFIIIYLKKLFGASAEDLYYYYKKNII